MSGGSYLYVSFKMDEAASTLRARHAQEPHVLALASHIEALAKVMRDIEWADSGDTSWTPKLDADIRAILQTPHGEIAEAVKLADTARTALEVALQAAAERDSDGSPKGMDAKRPDRVSDDSAVPKAIAQRPLSVSGDSDK